MEIGSPEVIAWLLEGDPAIRWQAMRDLLDAPEREWQAERARISQQGVGKRLLDRQDSDGKWAGGVYTPKWTSTTYTLLLMRDMGFDGSCEACARGFDHILKSICRSRQFGGCTCMVGMWLSLGLRFGSPHSVFEEMIAHLLDQQLTDGGWNCRWPRIAKTHHGSFHTTFNVLDGIREALEKRVGPADRLRQAEAQAIEFMLEHRLFRSDKTSKVIHPAFVQLHFPYRWHYDILRGLDYIRTTDFAADPRLKDAVQVILDQRRPDGHWPAAKTYSGQVFFPIEDGRAGSRWNTLRSLRSLRAIY